MNIIAYIVLQLHEAYIHSRHTYLQFLLIYVYLMLSMHDNYIVRPADSIIYNCMFKLNMQSAIQ